MKTAARFPARSISRGKSRHPAPRRMRGQALIWLLGTLAASAAVMYGVYNVGQLNASKSKTVNAADAAALAGATAQARLLNLMAYNNRGMIANEVFLIQMLSMESWLGYFGSTATNIGRVLRIGGLAVPGLQVAGQVLGQTGQMATQARGQLTRANNVVIASLELAKQGMRAAHGFVRIGGGVIAEDAASQVVAANRTTSGGRTDAGFQMDNSGAMRAATLLLNQRDWMSFTWQYQANRRQDARQVLLSSTDQFSTDRPGQAWMNRELPCVAGLEKRGGSRLVRFDRWETQDTFELWTARRLCGKRWTPLGWGRANAAPRRDSGSTWNPNRAAQRLARRDGRNGGHTHVGWSGVPAVFDISDRRTRARATLGVDFVVAVRRPVGNTMTSAQLGMGVSHSATTGSSEMNERLSIDQLSSISKARVFFERPQRGLSNDFAAATLWRPDMAKEYGSLFSPYWQARLTDLSPAEKGSLLAAMGLNPAFASVTPGGQ